MVKNEVFMFLIFFLVLKLSIQYNENKYEDKFKIPVSYGIPER